MSKVADVVQHIMTQLDENVSEEEEIASITKIALSRN
jgi:hypothetical protein